jgi:hypothetical protein
MIKYIIEEAKNNIEFFFKHVKKNILMLLIYCKFLQ